MTGVDLTQSTVVLTAHPLQRVGAYAMAALAGQSGDSRPYPVAPQDFERVMGVVRGDLVRAALLKDSKVPGGFWLKMSYSLFPNTPVNHPSNGRKSASEIEAAVGRWFTRPEAEKWPGTACVLCGRAAVGFYGKADVALAESESYRNSTPRGHAGMSLCWPCLMCFRALPYGCRLTGGPSITVHSWDEPFLRQTVGRQVRRTRRLAVVGDADAVETEAREVTVLTALRDYHGRVRAGVDLMVFNNNNRGQMLEVCSLSQPLAEWLRRVPHEKGWAAVERAQAGKDTPGKVGLARNAFRRPESIFVRAVHALMPAVLAGEREHVRAVVTLLRSFVTEVLLMHDNDLREIDATAAKIALLFGKETSGGKLKGLRAALREPQKLRSWLSTRAVEWAIDPRDDAAAPFVSRRALVLMFGPDPDNPAWFYRQYLLMGVLQELAVAGWRSQHPEDDTDGLDEVDSLSADKETEQ
ncbi:hypothetical protein [Actinokineospora cianjurensis]|uniref:CRISPR-associated protein Cst1 n=1 Tax=Actinokineospora cianjurensis TaxID=585224 RepID=A0A421B1V6_9PSEU|nr:hypothetical protein [Actinokineospora cianjurensis]RLK58374.1 hypothetical protein CLV68_4472 [Actinokineospora cianjurensis]